MQKLKAFIASIMPGIFLIGYNVGTGSITSMSKAGSNFGYDLLWTVLISCVITYYLILLFSRYTMVTGKTIVQGIKEDIHPALAIVLIGALSSIILVALMGVLGILSDVLQLTLSTFFKIDLSLSLLAVLISALLYLVIWVGNYKVLENTLGVLVGLMGLAFIGSMLIYLPSLSDFLGGFVPKIPQQAEGSDNDPFVIVAGMVGTTVSVFAFVIRSQMVLQEKWTMQQNKLQKKDAFVSASMMFLISMAVVVTAATALHTKGLKLNNVVEMIGLMRPIAGDYALFVFVIGILAAGLSSHLPNLLVIPWLVIDYQKKERSVQNAQSRIILLVLVVFSAIGVALGVRPLFVMMLSQASIAVVLPITLACTFYLTSQKKYMGDYKNTIKDYVFMGLIMLFALYMSSLGIQGLIADLTN